MVVVGTSGSVYPAANFVHWARQGGARTVYVGPEPPLNAHAFTNVVEGKAGEVLPGLFGDEIASQLVKVERKTSVLFSAL